MLFKRIKRTIKHWVNEEILDHMEIESHFSKRVLEEMMQKAIDDRHKDPLTPDEVRRLIREEIEKWDKERKGVPMKVKAQSLDSVKVEQSVDQIADAVLVKLQTLFKDGKLTLPKEDA